MRVSYKSNTRLYVEEFGSKAARNGGETLGRFVKLLGNTHVAGSAIAEAFRIAKGFLPVMDDELPALAAGVVLSILPADFAPAP